MIQSDELIPLLQERGFYYLHHANTVSTALTFLTQKALLSRAEVDSRRLWQTLQGTDKRDKIQGIYNNIFLDAENLWSQIGINHYGPVVFQYKLESLAQRNNIYVCKENPVNWGDNELRNWVFTSCQEIRAALESESYRWPLGYHIMLHEQPILDFTSLHKVICYLPPAEADLTGIDAINNPHTAFSALEQACDRASVPLERETMSQAHWNDLQPKKIACFYGFISKVRG